MAANKTASSSRPSANWTATIFTTLVAPILVSLAIRNLSASEMSPRDVVPVAAPPQTLSPLPVPLPAITPAAPRVQIMAHGAGTTPQLALQDALRNALRTAVAARVDALTWSRQGNELCALILREGTDLIVRYEERVPAQPAARGALYQRDVAVEVNAAALEQRLRLALTPGWNDPHAAPVH